MFKILLAAGMDMTGDYFDKADRVGYDVAPDEF
jgi:hypothetical protein